MSRPLTTQARVLPALAVISIILVTSLMTSSADSSPALKPASISGSLQIDLGGAKAGNSAPLDSCSFPYPGNFGSVIGGNWLQGDETYYVYQNPQTSSCSPATPFGITGLKMVLCVDDSCTTNIQFSIFDAVGDSCPTPGSLIYTTAPGQLTISGGMACPLISVIFGDTVCVNDDFFMSFTFPDSVNCFHLFTDTLPGPCISYNYAGDTLIDLSDAGFPGQIWVQTVGLNQAQSGCVQLQSSYSIPELYSALPAVDGQQVHVLCEYTNPTDGKIVTSYPEYMLQQLMPLNSIAYLTGAPVDSLFWNGGVIGVRGTVSTSLNSEPVYGADSVYITINADSIEYFIEGNLFPRVTLPPPARGQSPTPGSGDTEATCDSCKFAILISGGGDDVNNKDGFWEDLETLYKYKTDPAGGNYCPDNVKVLYYHGDSENPGVIPNDAVDSCTKANIQKAHDEIAHKIIECKRHGKTASVEKFVTNHGENDAGIVTLGNERVSPAELRAMQQTLIDSSCDYMYDEFTECFGGDMLDALEMLDNKGHTEIHGNSATGNNSPAVGDPDHGSAYLQEKVRLLYLGKSYEEAVKGAKDRYKAYLDSTRQRADSLLHRISNIADTISAADPDWANWQLLKQKLQQLVSKLTGSQNQGSPSFVSFPFNEYCEWRPVAMPSGGQIELTFSGGGGCGNVTVYCEQPDSSKKKYRIWNWNLPGSFGYMAGNETRVFNGDPTSDGRYWIHNDNGAFTLLAESLPTQSLAESPSNPLTFAGFSNGGTDASGDEYGDITDPTYATTGTDQLGFNLQDMPRQIGSCAGVGVYAAQFQAAQANPYWDDMYLWLNILNVTQPGQLEVQVNNAEIPVQTINITAAGIYALPLGQINAPSSGQIVFNSNTTSPPCFEWDSWGLRSNVETYPSFVCGDAEGNSSVSVGDVVFIINFIFGGGPAPDPLAAADADCSGGVSIGDAVYLINFIFGGGPAPCANCP